MSVSTTLKTFASLQNDTSATSDLNNNFAAINTALASALALNGQAPNQMQANLDMNSNSILNLPTPISNFSPIRLVDAATLGSGGTITVNPLPVGGTAGQVLTKNSSTNFDVSWLPITSLSSFTQVNISPAAGSLATGLNIVQSYAGSLSTGPSEIGLNTITVTSDTANISGGTPLALNDLYITHSFGGSSVQGGRNAIFANLIQTVSTSASNTNLNYVAVTGVSQTNSGDGGTNTGAGARGAYFGANQQARSNGATNVFQLCGSENDIYGTVASTQRYVMCYSAGSLHSVQGASLDAAYEMHSGGAVSGGYGPGGGFGFGLCFAELNNGLPPVSSGATLIGSHLESLGTVNALNGVDLTGFTFSGSAFKSTGFTVGPTGNVNTPKVVLQNTIPFGINFNISGVTQNIIGQVIFTNDWVIGSVTGDLVFRNTAINILATTDGGTTISFKIAASNGGVSFLGTNTNSNAASKYVGEYITSGNITGVVTSSATPVNVTSISLTAGDWEVNGLVSVVPAATTTLTQVQGVVSLTTASLTPVETGNLAILGGTLGTAAAGTQSIALPTTRVSLASTTTIFLNAQATFATSTLTSGGILRARRVR